MSLALINSQISTVQDSINSLNYQTQQKREELERLKKALYELTDCKYHFQSNLGLCIRPEMTANTWYGNTANRFDTIRNDRIVTNYKAMVNNDLTKVVNRIKETIETTEQSIGSMQSSATTLNTRLNRLYSQRRKELII